VGFAISLTSVSEQDRPVFLTNAGLSETSAPDPENETRLSGALWQGQYLTWRNERMTKGLASPEYGLISKGTSVLTLGVDETAMGAVVALYEDGKEVWGASGLEDQYVADGPVPLEEDELKELCYAQTVAVFGQEQAKADAEEDADFTDPFSMVVELFVAQTGFRYDGHDVENFMELAGEMPFPKPWWKFW